MFCCSADAAAETGRTETNVTLRSTLLMLVPVLVGLPACKSNSADGEFEEQRRTVESLTLPTDGSIVTRSSSHRGTYFIAASWQIETKQSWTDYTRWLGDQLRSRFEATGTAEAAVHFVNHLPGDDHSVQIDRLSGGPPLRARVTFTASAR